MKNNQIRTDGQAQVLADEAMQQLSTVLKERHRKAVNESVKNGATILNEKIDLDAQAEVTDPSNRVSPREFTFGEFLDVYKTKRGDTERIAATLNISPKMVSRLKHHIRLNDPELLRGIGPDRGHRGGEVYSGTGRRGSIDDIPIFDGEVYQHQTRIPPRRWRLWSAKTSIKQRPALPFFRRWDKIFLFGFQFESLPDLFYELWFDTGTSTYEIHDKFGDQVGDNYVRMNDAVDTFVDLIGSFGSQDQNEFGKKHEEDAKKEVERELFKRAKDTAKDAAQKAQNFEESFTADSVFADVIKEDDGESIRALFLERTINTRGMLADFIKNELIQEYHVSRMTRQIAKQKFYHVFSRKPEMPNKFLGGGIRNKVSKIFGGGNEATFVVGLTLADRVDVEIWFIKTDEDTGTAEGASFWVFDLTSGKVIERGIQRPRDAYQLAARKLAAQSKE